MMNSVKTVGRYELLDPIGYGGMAVVYLARQTDLDRLVALKELRLFQAPDDPGLAERFLREAHMAGKMSHPNLVTVHEYFEHEGTPYIAMEYLQRGSLRPWVGRMSTAQIGGVLEGMLAALDHAEGYGIVHRDLKPENLLVTDQGQVKVADFGIAKPPVTQTSPVLTATGTTVGTPTYMAPEQAMGHRLGPYTDLYSVGVMAYEFFVGRPPFDDTDTPVAIILRHVNEQIPSPHTVNPSIDRGVSDWIDRLLVKEPAERTQTAEQAWDELEEVVLRLLGSRWRRDARLVPTAQQPVAQELTPAPFTSGDLQTPVPETTSDAFQSFAWGAPAARLQRSDAHAVAPLSSAGPDVLTPPPAPVSPAPAQPPAAPVPAQPSVTAGRPAFDTDAPARPQFEELGEQAPSPVEARTVMPDALPLRPQPPAQTAPSPAFDMGRYAVLGGGVAAVAAVAVVGVLLAGGGGSDGESGPATVVRKNADLALSVPASWTQRSVPAIAGLHRRDAVTAARGSGAFVTAELARGRADPTLLPSKLLAAQKGRPKPQTITLTGRRAYRYDELRGSGRPLRVYALLTTEGVATVACGAAARDCDDIARTLKLTSARALPAGPSTSYAATLNKAFRRLDGRTKTAKSNLGAARPGAAQAAALQPLASAYETAGRLGGGGLNVVDARLNAELTSLFTYVAASYGALERSLRSGDTAAQARAQRTLKRLRARTAAAGVGLARAGYTDRPPRPLVPTLSPPRRAAVAPPPQAAPPPVAPQPNSPSSPARPQRSTPPPPPPPSDGGSVGGSIG
jgi:serine/threonine protein kinase